MAEVVAERASRRTGDLIIAYECADCGSYHIGHPERGELARLDTLTRTVGVALCSFIDRYLAELLATLAHKGVRIPCVPRSHRVAQEMRRRAVTTKGILLAAGVKVDNGAKDLMHLKSYSIDGCLLRSGFSYGTQAPGQRPRAWTLLHSVNLVGPG